MAEGEIAYVVMMAEQGDATAVKYVLFPESLPWGGISGVLPTVPGTMISAMRMLLAGYGFYDKMNVGPELDPKTVEKIAQALSQTPEDAGAARQKGPMGSYATLEELASGVREMKSRGISGVKTQSLPDYLPDIGFEGDRTIFYSPLPANEKSELGRLLSTK